MKNNIIGNNCITGINNNDIDENKYDKRKWKKIMDITQNNYANILKRLTRKSKVSNNVLISYSIFLIMCSLTSKYFPSRFNVNLAEYFNIVLSVIILVYSLINNNANYNIRIVNMEKSLNDIKDIKRKLNEESLEECIEKYNKITSQTERREDVDFFITVKNLCKKHNINWFTKREKKNKIYSIKEELSCNEEINKKNKREIEAINNYLCEINVIHEEIKLILEYFWYLILILIPFIIFFSCILVRFNNE
ncbi:SLATT domain-containing protein [Clostridium cochlearium]|uniref:SLATT domain-containing protein n=1 Tax=Clostridium cochlearium TaxID=1494 RepID=UPI000BBCA0CE|nr:SLATT domain-containing protein [Clostridium cochlearium]